MADERKFQVGQRVRAIVDIGDIDDQAYLGDYPLAGAMGNISIALNQEDGEFYSVHFDRFPHDWIVSVNEIAAIEAPAPPADTREKSRFHPDNLDMSLNGVPVDDSALFPDIEDDAPADLPRCRICKLTPIYGDEPKAGICHDCSNWLEADALARGEQPPASADAGDELPDSADEHGFTRDEYYQSESDMMVAAMDDMVAESAEEADELPDVIDQDAILDWKPLSRERVVILKEGYYNQLKNDLAREREQVARLRAALKPAFDKMEAHIEGVMYPSETAQVGVIFKVRELMELYQLLALAAIADAGDDDYPYDPDEEAKISEILGEMEAEKIRERERQRQNEEAKTTDQLRAELAREREQGVALVKAQFERDQAYRELDAALKILKPWQEIEEENLDLFWVSFDEALADFNKAKAEHKEIYDNPPAADEQGRWPLWYVGNVERSERAVETRLAYLGRFLLGCIEQFSALRAAASADAGEEE